MALTKDNQDWKGGRDSLEVGWENEFRSHKEPAILSGGPQPREVSVSLHSLKKASDSGESGIPFFCGELIHDLVCRLARQGEVWLHVFSLPVSPLSTKVTQIL